MDSGRRHCDTASDVLGCDGECALRARAGSISPYAENPHAERSFSHRNGFGPRAPISPDDNRSSLGHPSHLFAVWRFTTTGVWCGGSFPANAEDGPNVG